jgi:hypothetical protein
MLECAMAEGETAGAASAHAHRERIAIASPAMIAKGRQGRARVAIGGDLRPVLNEPRHWEHHDARHD